MSAPETVDIKFFITRACFDTAFLEISSHNKMFLIYTYLLFHLLDEFERLQVKEAGCNLLLKTDFHQKNLQRRNCRYKRNCRK